MIDSDSNAQIELRAKRAAALYCYHIEQDRNSAFALEQALWMLFKGLAEDELTYFQT